ncbi:MAG: type II toxin-antitoxin system VapC family toxin [Candidatus Diapherotrites archaeon]|nr:type II toxin-antitoxin system VapC family toxin [Candidatus Diapherotrites archaeon]
MYFVDTNVFLEWFLGRKNAKDCELFFEKIVSGKIISICSRFSIYSILIHITNRDNVEKAKKFLEFINSNDNLIVVNTGVSDDLKILELVEKSGLDFDDALQDYVATESNCEAIITFDADFKNKTKILTLTPTQALELI